MQNYHAAQLALLSDEERASLRAHPELVDFIDPRMKECPYVGYPTGWFIAAFSREIQPASVKAVRYFGKDLVIWRSAAGAVRIMDAHCPHMGANLGRGAPGVEHEFGKVIGDSIQCPWHGWRWGGDGRNVEIPDSAVCNKHARVRVWPSQEILGRFILVWHDSLGREPLWAAPVMDELVNPRDYYLEEDHLRYGHMENVFLPLPMFTENLVDGAHVKFVHGSEIAQITVLQDEGPVYRSRFDVVFRSRRSGHTSAGHIIGEGWGQGIVVNRNYGAKANLMLVGATPTNGWHCDVRAVHFGAREEGLSRPSELAMRAIEHHLERPLREDIEIMNHGRYLWKPIFTAKEATNFLSVRRWTQQFYPLMRPEFRYSTQNKPASVAAE